MAIFRGDKLYFDELGQGISTGLNYDNGLNFDGDGSLITGTSELELVEQSYVASEILDLSIVSKFGEIEDYSKYVNLMELVPLKFHDSVVLQELLDECGILTGTWIGKINDIEKLADKYNVEEEYIQQLADLVGYQIVRADTSSLTEKRRQLIQVIDWYKEKGTYVSLEHIAYVLGFNIEISDLYTNDYSTFFKEDWFVGNEGQNPGGLDPSYYKSPHMGIDLILDRSYGTIPDNYLLEESMVEDLTEYVELVRPINVVPHYSALLVPESVEVGAVYITAALIYSTTTSAWDYTKYYFDGAFGPTGVGINFDDGKFFDNSPTSFLAGVTHWKLGTGNKGVPPTRDNFALETVVLTGTVDDYTIYDDRIEFEFNVPENTAQLGISELGLYLTNTTTLVFASTFPDIDLVTDGPQLRVRVKIFRRSSLNILVSIRGADNLGYINEMWMQENIQQEWHNYYDATYNRLCADGKSTNRWDTWNMSWDEAEAGNYCYDFPRVVEDYYWQISTLDFGPYYAGLVAAIIIDFKSYLTDCIKEVRTSPDFVTWSSWAPFTSGLISNRFVQMRGKVVNTDPYGIGCEYNSIAFIAVPLT